MEVLDRGVRIRHAADCSEASGQMVTTVSRDEHVGHQWTPQSTTSDGRRRGRRRCVAAGCSDQDDPSLDQSGDPATTATVRVEANGCDDSAPLGAGSFVARELVLVFSRSTETGDTAWAIDISEGDGVLTRAGARNTVDVGAGVVPGA